MAGSIEILNQIIKDGSNRGLIHHHTEDAIMNGRTVTIEGQEQLNFGSCSYLGLEVHPQLKEGVIDAVTRYGTQFSSSRTYLSLGLYDELETTLRGVFEKPVMVTASTTLGHLATLPVVVGDNDAIILDLQVHSSVQMVAQLLKARKVPIYVIRHNCIKSLETKIQQLNNKHDKIWYFANGVYSMYGDFAPFQQLETLLNQYKKFHLYIDDAHGMRWTGKNGIGVVRSHMDHHDNELEQTFLELGLISYNLLNNCVLPSLNWDNRTAYLERLSNKYRYNVRKEILKFEDRFLVDTSKPSTAEEISACYDLYKSVFDQALELNVFQLPLHYFEAMCADERYDMIRLYLRPEQVEGATEPVLAAVLFSEVNTRLYNAMIVGLDYRFVREHGTYKQTLFQSVERVKAVGCTTLDLAYTAELVKKKLGAQLQQVRAFVQSTEHFNHQVLESMQH